LLTNMQLAENPARAQASSLQGHSPAWDPLDSTSDRPCDRRWRFSSKSKLSLHVMNCCSQPV